MTEEKVIVVEQQPLLAQPAMEQPPMMQQPGMQ